MAISFNPQIRFTSETPIKKDNNASTATAPAEVQAPQPQKAAPAKKVPLSNFASKVAYAWINLSEGVKGFFKGAFAAFVTGTTIAGLDTIISGINKKAYKEIFTKPKQAMGAVGKIVAPIVSAFVFAGYIIGARMNANKRTADVDHKLGTGHRV